MGFLKRFLSFGSRKGKKKHGRDVHLQESMPYIPEGTQEDQETAVGRLLRSSSAHYTSGSEVDYSSLPPIPHPINNIRTPTASTVSVASASISQRGTYTVKVGQRMHHGSTEFPNAYPKATDPSSTPQRDGDATIRHPLITPRDKNRLHGLRQDPSVASLLNMYDDHGRLDSKAFSNTPPSPSKHGRMQTRRTGSTLRQLLGGSSLPSSDDGGEHTFHEGDISWAERLLQGNNGDNDSVTSTSSLGLETPTDAHFINDHLNNAHTNTTFSSSTENENSTISVYPAISSMEVELSIVTEHEPDLSPYPYSPYQNAMSPRRASEVFSFLKNKHSPKSDEDRPLPPLPPTESHFSDASFSDTSDTCYIPPSGKVSPLSQFQIRHSPPSSCDHNPPCQNHENTFTENILRDGPKVHQVSITGASEAHFSRIPRGPRPNASMQLQTCPASQSGQPLSSRTHASMGGSMNHLQSASHKNVTHMAPSIQHLDSNDGIVQQANTSSLNDLLPPRQSRFTHGRVASQSSSNVSVVDFEDEEYVARHPPPSTTELVMGATQNSAPLSSNKRSLSDDRKGGASTHATLNGRHLFGLNNSASHSTEQPKTQIPPITPVRSRPFFRPLRGMTPSPASSSELSPVAQQLMTNLREKRMQAREESRKHMKGRHGGRANKLHDLR